MMRWTKWSWWALTAVLFFGSAVAQAYEPEASGAYPMVGGSWQMEAVGEEDVALVVAVERYFRLPAVAGARETARDWGSFFRDGLGVGRVYELLDDEVTREAMERFARQAAQDVGEGGTLWFVFVGHGAPAAGGDDGLLLGVDAQQTVESVTARSLTQSQMLQWLGEGAQARTVAIVDACFSGRDSEGASLVPNLQPVLPVEYQPPTRQGTVVLSAARSNEFAGALPGADRPAFSYWMLGALRGWAAEDDGGLGTVTAAQALAFTRQKLRSIQGRLQNPEGTGDLDLVLVRGVQEADPLPGWNGRLPEAVVEQEQERREQNFRTTPPRPAVALQTRSGALAVAFQGDWLLENRQSGERAEGAEIYRMLGEERLARQFEENALRRDRSRSSARILTWSGIGAVALGTTMVSVGYLRKLPEDDAALDHCGDFLHEETQNNCRAQESFDAQTGLRTTGWIALAAGTTATIWGWIWRGVTENRPTHPVTPLRLRQMVNEANAEMANLPVDQKREITYELAPYYSPGEDSRVGVVVGLRW